jgi:MoaA/NifB/PqqE/SkfB family radical SAM enzyme
MTTKLRGLATVDEAGRLIVPPELATRLGIIPGAQVWLDEEAYGGFLHRPVTQLAKVYIEPTSRCNLTCRTCIRNNWDEQQGDMSESVFERVIAGLRALPAPPKVTFGGFGEPLTHPRIAEMVRLAKSVANPVELITNGILLTQELSRRLIEAGLDVLWISLDGVTPESYSDVRLGAALPRVLENLAVFQAEKHTAGQTAVDVGIAFVAMQRNIADLPELLSRSTRLGASRYMVTNVLPYTEEMTSEMLYRRSMDILIETKPSQWAPHVDMPRMDMDANTREAIYRMNRGGYNIHLSGDYQGKSMDRCPFVERGVIAIGWDGSLSPCLPLMHNHTSYLEKRRKRLSRRYVVGNLSEHNLETLWTQPDYVSFRQRVQAFDFSPCTICGGCDLSEFNEEDCFGNSFPTCGGCLWAQGVIQCP